MTDTRDKTTLLAEAVDAALALAAESPWDAITLRDIANKAGICLPDFYGIAEKSDIASAIEERFDQAAASEAIDTGDSPRERLFDVIMLRIEAMEDQRDAVLSLRRSQRFPSSSRLSLARYRYRSAKWMLTCAGLDEDMIEARAAVIGRIMARAESAWEKDIHGDFAQTMARLDGDLKSLEQRLRWFRNLGQNRTHDPASSPNDVPEGSSSTVH